MNVPTLERNLLCALCHGTGGVKFRESASLGLREYSWTEALHQAIFEALMALPSTLPENLQALLASKLTRMGFPDTECGSLFASNPLSVAQANECLRQLLAHPAQAKSRQGNA